MLQDSYNLLFKLGFGEFGEVWKGESLSKQVDAAGEEVSGKFPVAIKIFKRTCKEFIINNELNMNEEVMLLEKKLGHPSLIKVYGVDLLTTGATSESLRKTLVMEFLAGGELFDRIVNRGSFSEKDAALTVHSLTSALSSIHQHCIIHRDLKPENVVYRSQDANAAPVIVDFGFAAKGTPEAGKPRNCIFHDKNARMALGTPGYIAPESYSHNVYLDKSDMWSLGIIVYIILVGFPPFDNKDRLLKERTLRGKFYPLNTGPWAHISPEAKDLVSSLMCVNPNERLDAQQVLDHPWILRYVKEQKAASANLRGLPSPRAPDRMSPVAPSAELSGVPSGPRMDNEMRASSRRQSVKLDVDVEEEAEEGEFDADYVKRIERMSNRRKLKKTVNGVVCALRFRAGAMQAALRKEKEGDILSPGASVGMDVVDPDEAHAQGLEFLGEPGGGDYAMPPPSTPPCPNVEDVESEKDFSITIQQLTQLKEALVISKSTSTSNPQVEVVKALVEPRRDSFRFGPQDATAVEMRSLEKESAVVSSFQTNGGCDFKEFCFVVKSVGLHVLATKQIFDIFDMDDSGVVSPIEFISTVAQFQAASQKDDNCTPEERMLRTKLFFSLFDQDGNGTISRRELENVVGMLLNDRSPTASMSDMRSTTVTNEKDAAGVGPELQHTFSDRYDKMPTDALTAHGVDEADLDYIPDTFTEINMEIDCKELFDSIDTDNSGEICFDEFSVWFNENEKSNLFSNLVDPIQVIEKKLLMHFDV